VRAGHDRPSLPSGLEPGRRAIGWLGEVGFKAYGAAAAASVALSDSETIGGKSQDAVGAVSNLMDRYRAAKYVTEHREEIRDALDYLRDHTPPQSELAETVDRSSETLRDLETVSTEIEAARAAVGDMGLLNFRVKADELLDHLGSAWAARPDSDALGDLAAAADQASPYVDQVREVVPVYYGSVFALVDNFARDEIVGTLAVMGFAFAIAFAIGQAFGFWARRGRPGLIARTLQRWGARRYRDWYASDPERTLSQPLYAAALEGVRRDLVADLRDTLDPGALRQVEQYLEEKRGRDPSG
jgi:hypothetical protein